MFLSKWIDLFVDDAVIYRDRPSRWTCQWLQRATCARQTTVGALLGALLGARVDLQKNLFIFVRSQFSQNGIRIFDKWAGTLLVLLLYDTSTLFVFHDLKSFAGLRVT